MIEIYECYGCDNWFKKEECYRLRGTRGISPSSEEAKTEGRIELYICKDCFREKMTYKKSSSSST